MRNKFTMKMSICQAGNGFFFGLIGKKLADSADFCHKTSRNRCFGGEWLQKWLGGCIL